LRERSRHEKGHRSVTDHRRSYWKTIILALVASAVLLALASVAMRGALAADAAWPAAGLRLVAAIVLAPAGLTCLLIAAGGLMSLRRDTLEASGRPYGLPHPRKGVSATES
jgi:hypothetical protein